MSEPQLRPILLFAFAHLRGWPQADRRDERIDYRVAFIGARTQSQSASLSAVVPSGFFPAASLVP